MSIIQDILADIDGQLANYRADRAVNPSAYGPADGCFDGTDPQHGPMPLALLFKRGDGYDFRVIWGVHKHAWPMDFWYCIGNATDSRGERTAEHLMLDIRDLPKGYIGRYKLEPNERCDRRSHQKVLERALADGFNLEAHISRLLADERASAAERAQTRLINEAAGRCKQCGATPVEASGYCTPCDEVPF